MVLKSTLAILGLAVSPRWLSMATTTVPIVKGYGGRAVPNRFLRRRHAIDRLALLLPGFGDTLDMPRFSYAYYAENLLLERGWDVLRVEVAYGQRPDFRTLPEAEQARWLLADATAAWRPARLRRRRFDRQIARDIGDGPVSPVARSHARPGNLLWAASHSTTSTTAIMPMSAWLRM